jgi:hypothetical protein
MHTRTRYFFLLAGFMLGGAATAQQWFSVAGPGAEASTTGVEVDLDSLRPRAGGGEGVIRITYDSPRPHGAEFRFRSIVANARFDCQRRSISLNHAAYYPQPAGGGPQLGADDSGSQGGMPADLLDSVPATARRALLRASCANSRQPAG